MINRENVGRIAERIAANELEAHGFQVSDLNRDGIAANADLVAMFGGRSLQIQVKGATNGEGECWLQYGYCTDAIIKQSQTMYNRYKGFYKADIVVLVAIRSVKDYNCFVLPVEKAERAAQLALDRDYRTPKRDGGSKKPNKVYVELHDRRRVRREICPELIEERTILETHRDERGWSTLLEADWPDSRRWSDFFLNAPRASDDFITDREQPPPEEREPL